MRGMWRGAGAKRFPSHVVHRGGVQVQFPGEVFLQDIPFEPAGPEMVTPGHQFSRVWRRMGFCSFQSQVAKRERCA